MTRELIEVVEQEVLIDQQPELMIDEVDVGGEVVDAADNELLIDGTPDLLVVETDQQTTLLDVGTPGPPGPPGEIGQSYVEFPAALPIGGHRAVRLQAGQAIYADNTSTADANLVLGVTRGAVNTGELAQIQTAGLMTEVSWTWTPDAPVFCGLMGALTQIPPLVGFSLVVGIATSPTQILIGAKSPIVLE